MNYTKQSWMDLLTVKIKVFCSEYAAVSLPMVAPSIHYVLVRDASSEGG